jgi:squalene-hopene/tetraprenyl-beta-curcumene cyclase
MNAGNRAGSSQFGETHGPFQGETGDSEREIVRIGSFIQLPDVTRSIARARDWLLERQQPEGWWCGELGGDTTLESYIILLQAFLGRRESPVVARLAQVIRDEVLPRGGWSSYPEGPPDLSVSCLSYFALKLAGDGPDLPHMGRSREVILGLGGAARANSYTRYHLALFGQCGWDEVPAVPPEMVLLPPAAPFSIHDMSAWSRTIFVPLSVVYAHRPVVSLPQACQVGELFVRTPTAAPALSLTGRFFIQVDRVIKRLERLPGVGRVRRLALRRAAAWIRHRLVESDGLGAILPAMTTSVLALKCLGMPEDDPVFEEALAQLDRLVTPDGLRVQPCLSPVWDTCLASYALAQAGVPPRDPALARAAAWLLSKQCRRPGDWAARNPVPPGGWFFEFRNEHYPDVDDTCMALMVLQHAQAPAEGDQQLAMSRGLRWMLGMQNPDGGWASFDRGNDKRWLTEVPFADHNAMIDPSTADITGRVLECLGHLGGFDVRQEVVRQAITFLQRQQEMDGCWYGRWGVNYIYGTAHVLRGLHGVGEDMDQPYVRRAASWLETHQNADGGWGESIASYDDPRRRGQGASTPSQTAWALMGLIAAKRAEGSAVRRGIRWLLDRQSPEGTWAQAEWTGTGFPRVFYLDYPFYRHHFPLMALAQYQAATTLKPR